MRRRRRPQAPVWPQPWPPAPWWPTKEAWAWAKPPSPVALPQDLFHFDMYRLNSADDLFDIGWEDYLARGGVCAVEWSENVADALPEDTVRVRIAREGDTGRCITIEGVDLP